MGLTPIDIRNKEFGKAIRGYNCDDVDKFLDSVSKDFEVLFTENFDLREKVRHYDAELSRYKNLEATLQQTMVMAQQTSEEVKKGARYEAELLLREAEQEKNQRMAEAQKKIDELQEEIEELVRKRELIRTQLKSFLRAQLDLADAFEHNLNAS
ncbi:MAG: DivIVA domain-containing protein [Desulfitobacterium hafniense]|nr:DivIVA domain-containing protein [Desulfitobacterium hafniense]